MQAPPTLPPQITERYEIKRELGRGGFATVYLASDSRLQREVAIKVYTPKDDRESEEKNDESRLLAQLEHPNIVRIYDREIIRIPHKPDIAFMVMEYLGGGSLRDKLRPGTSMRPQDAMGLVAVLAEALHYAHEMHILHLDIKPENIIFDNKGRPVLTDFGIGRAMGGDHQTRQSVAFGTTEYASPEQRNNMMLGRTADIYSLGVVLFELLTGQKPLGPAPVKPAPPFSPPFPLGHPLTAAGDLVKIVCKALAAIPEYRYENALVFAQTLRDYLRHSGDGTGRLFSNQTRLQTRTQFQYSPVNAVQIDLSDVAQRETSLRHVPEKSADLAHDIATLVANTKLNGIAYSHQAFEVGPNALVEQAVFARGMVRLRQDAIVRGDVMSLTAIEAAPGVQARNLMAPEVRVRGPIRLAGSIFCRHLKTTQENDKGLGVHLPDGSELNGSLIFGREFEKITPDDQFGRPLAEPRPAMNVYQRPHVRVGSNCTMLAVLGDVDVSIGPRQKSLNTIRVQGDVELGHSNLVQRIYGQNVRIDGNCTVNEIYAEGKLIIGPNCTIGYMRAKKGIELSNGVVISSPIFFTDDGTIIERGEAKWRVVKDIEQKEIEVGDLSARNLFDSTHAGKRGGLGTVMMDHRLHGLYERIAGAWYAALRPATFEGSGDQVRQVVPKAAPVTAADGSYLNIDMDLTPAGMRDDDEDADVAVDERLIRVEPLAPAQAAPPSFPAAPTTMFGGGNGNDDDQEDEDDYDDADLDGDDFDLDKYEVGGASDGFTSVLPPSDDEEDLDDGMWDDEDDGPPDTGTRVLGGSPFGGGAKPIFPGLGGGQTRQMGSGLSADNPKPRPSTPNNGIGGGQTRIMGSGLSSDNPKPRPSGSDDIFGSSGNRPLGSGLSADNPKPRPSGSNDLFGGGKTRMMGDLPPLDDNPTPRPSGRPNTYGSPSPRPGDPNRPGMTRFGRDKFEDEEEDDG